ncbi:MAG: phage tail protein [Thermaurantiacus sp.]
MAIERDNPWPAWTVTVDLGDGEERGFAEVSGLSVEVDVIEYREGRDRTNMVRKVPGLVRVGEITLRRGMAGKLDLFQWLRTVIAGRPERRDVRIRLYSEDRADVVLSWKLVNAWPRRHVSGPFRAGASEVAVEELVLVAEGLEIE